MPLTIYPKEAKNDNQKIFFSSVKVEHGFQDEKCPRILGNTNIY